MSNFILFIMPLAIRKSTRDFNSGAISIDCNAATLAGGGTIAAGVLLATAVGTAVAPAPTLGTVALGGGILAAGQWKELKGYFGPDKSVVINPTPAEAKQMAKEDAAIDEVISKTVSADTLATAAAAVG